MDILLKFLMEIWLTSCQMAPYLLFGFLFAGILSLVISPALVEKHLGGKGIIPSIKASLFGVPLPLCSCGVIPVFASLRKNGAGKGASISFLISTPQTGVDSIFVTWSLLGPVFAIFKPIAAFVSGVAGGIAVELFGGKIPGESSDKPVRPESCDAPCCAKKTGKMNILKKVLSYSFVTLMDDIAKSLIIGILIAAAISTFVPDNWISSVSGSGIPAMLMMMAIGIPLYVCASASVPIAAALIVKGISPGAAFVFLMTGPATNAAAIATVWKLLGKRAVFVYLLSLAVTSIMFGLLLDSISPLNKSITDAACHHDESIAIWQIVSAVILWSLCLLSIWKKTFKTRKNVKEEAKADGKSIELHVIGMTCGHCMKTMENSFKELPGLKSVSIELKSGRTILEFNDSVPDFCEIRKKVESCGFKVRSQHPTEWRTTEK